MDNLYNYFLRYSDKINFLTIKKIKIKNNEYENIDFPVNSKTLLENIKENKFNNEISVEYFIEGIILLNAIDQNFKNIDLLNKFLEKFGNDNIISFVKSNISFENTSIECLIYNLLLLRGLFILNIVNDFIIKLYIKHLILFYDYIDENFKNILLNEIKINLSTEFLKNENDPFINMLYGDLNESEKFYIKADLFYKKALKFSFDSTLKNIISKKIADIKTKVLIENLLQLVDNFRFEKAFKILSKIDYFNLDKEDYYWIAYSYNKLNEIDKSIEYYEKALELKADFLNIFIELGLLYYKKNQIQKSLKIFENGLKIYIDDEKLLFNKIVLELKLKLFEKAKKDIDKILLYEDLDNAIMNDVLYLKNLYQKELN